MKQAYVYYRIDPGQAAHAAEQIDRLLSRLACHCSQPPRRLIRCDDAVTWLEVYEGIVDFTAFTTALESAVRNLDCAAFTLSGRQLECFSPPVPAAEGTTQSRLDP